ncbi:hypothetical protein RNO37_23710, partial [Escherichia coli]|nr:hypothetical protein [Escherichia coli]MDW6646986.1 hypothetical protein [Escherichia coli]
MANHIQGQGRHQVTLLPDALDDFVTEDNPVRVVDIFVDGLKLDSLGFRRVDAKRTGRPGYHPATLLKLYIYGKRTARAVLTGMCYSAGSAMRHGSSS